VDPKWAYNFNEHVERHAYETYDAFLNEYEQELKKLPAPKIAGKSAAKRAREIATLLLAEAGKPKGCGAAEPARLLRSIPPPPLTPPPHQSTTTLTRRATCWISTHSRPAPRPSACASPRRATSSTCSWCVNPNP
jgi:hypothetical protein